MAKRFRRVLSVSVFIVLVYIVAFPRPLGPELLVELQHGVLLDDAVVVGGLADQPKYFFLLGSRFGFVDDSGQVAYLDTVQEGIAVSPSRFINFSSVSETHVVQGGAGHIQTVISAAGYPVLGRDRQFILSPNASRISEWGTDGVLLYERDFGSLITAFDVGDQLSVVGLLSGELVFLNAEGEELQSYRSRRSRVSVIYGLEFDNEGSRLAVVSGVDPQVLSLLEHDGERFVARFEREVSSVLREPVPVHFVPGSGRLVVEQQGADGALSLLSMRNDGRDSVTLPLAGRLHSFLPDAGPGLNAALSLRVDEPGDAGYELLLTAGMERMTARVPFIAEPVFLGSGPNDSVLLGIDTRLIQLRFREG